MRAHALRLLLALGLAARAAPTPPSSCKFAAHYTCASLVASPSTLAAFTLDMARAEAAHHAAGIGYDGATGYTLDGQPLDFATGLAAGPPHAFSAPSKESLHVALLALAINGSAVAGALYAPAAAVALLARKVAAYETWNASYPGAGCFMPWVAVSAAGLAPTADWATPLRLPGLDNGEWAWALLAASAALDAAGERALGARYRAYFDCLAGNAKAIFYAGGGRVAAIAAVHDVLAPVAPDNYDRTGALADPYEGETLTVLLDLFADWSDPAERDSLWAAKRAQLVARDYAAWPSGARVTTQLGFWFSAHEQWKTLLLPYLDVPLVRDIFANAERVRTMDAARHGVPGLFASVNGPTRGGNVDGGYISALGVPEMASQSVTRRDVVTPYGAAMLFLHNASAAACWHREVLAARRGQGPLGATAALFVNGSGLAPLVTWDSSDTTILGAAGGASMLVRGALAPAQYARFVTVVAREHAAVFGARVAGTGEAFALPTASVPRVLDEWAACSV